MLVKGISRVLPLMWSTECRLFSTKTIYALSSGKGKCGVSVVRVSGPQSKDALRQLTKRRNIENINPRQMYLSKFFDSETKELLDKGMFVWFPGPHSFTGEDSCELHIHGGTSVIAGILNALSKVPGFHPAEKGEFTKRAFINGKLDLTEVEGLADVLSAETEAQRRQAIRQMDGCLHKCYMGWRQRLKMCLANIEAYIDFSEDQHIEDDVMKIAADDINRLISEIELHLQDNRRGERIRNGIRIVILGEPNVGKSSLLNALCQKNAAIVSPIAGTTRDVIEVSLDIGGYPVVLTDTAGIRESSDFVEQEGVKRALTTATHADILLLVADPASLIQVGTDNFEKYLQAQLIPDLLKNLGISLKSVMSSSDLDPIVKSTNSIFIADDCKMVLVLNKLDVLKEAVGSSASKWDKVLKGNKHVFLSCKTGENMEMFVNHLTDIIKSMCGNPLAENPALTQVRHRQHLRQCVLYLHQYIESTEDSVLAAEKIRKAILHLGKITGKVTSDEILDVIFKEFCIGK